MEQFLFRLAWSGLLSEREQTRIKRVIVRERSFAANSEVVPAGKRLDFSTVMLTGMSCRQRVLRGGSRQVTAFQLPGDFCDLHSYMVKTLEESIVAITDCKVGIVPHEEIDAIIEEESNVARLLWLSTLIDASIYREWIVSLGRRQVLGRLGHLFCELYVRLKAVDLVDGNSYPLPVTQQDISDAMGTSLVHTNRVLGTLRKEGLATFANRRVTIHDWPALQEVSEFDPLYLHLD